MNLGNNHHYFPLSGYLSNAIHQSPTPVLRIGNMNELKKRLGNDSFSPQITFQDRQFAYIFSYSANKTTDLHMTLV